MTEYLTLDSLLLIAARAVGSEVAVRDYGLLESALARPQATVFGADAYPSLHGKAAALLHSLVRNHALVDGDKRLAWQATAVFLWLNGYDVDAPDDDLFDLVMAAADGSLGDVETIAERLAAITHPAALGRQGPSSAAGTIAMPSVRR
ncbi:type II toxin-antitoxin system death-on-curing family toxin [Pseudonocardia asaccharolytica]|uniref:Toxin Doc n=1 Tax=Pseudonocardia asaccharolytica DSM 44247 = NBRC 16224 TaxID=1123024 RepID=A0A511D3W9_9PSEU|nr:type II toxin-antitoxin system death-on-curing family toxin [Pseudonocardia asaccharolytica]GEL19492.1 toxin Doc [Pseudonocardia asaccharolytica DSM 44247 = NBRC 16224]